MGMSFAAGQDFLCSCSLVIICIPRTTSYVKFRHAKSHFSESCLARVGASCFGWWGLHSKRTRHGKSLLSAFQTEEIRPRTW